MIINFTPQDFTEDILFYSPAFKQSAGDTLVTVAVWLSVTGTTKLQASINKIDWVDIADTTFDCNLVGLQTYVDCHLGLVYRIVTSEAITKAQILI